MRRGDADGGAGRGAVAPRRLVAALLAALALASLVALAPRALGAQDDAPLRLDRARFTAVYYPHDAALAGSLLAAAVRSDSFPWLPRPRQHVLIAIAPDAAHFRAWAGASAPEWGAALAFPESRRVVMQGQAAGSDAGDPVEVLRHELAHLALHERLGALPPRWFDEGYASVAAREWRRDDVLAANVALAVRGAPTLDRIEAGFDGGSVAAQSSYALSYRAVTELASFDRERGLSLFFRYWAEDGSLDVAVRRAFGVTLAGFEQEFQRRTRRRYGALALFADLSLAMFVLSMLLLPFFIARRVRDRRRLSAMLAGEQAAERREAALAIEALLGASVPDAPPPGPPPGPPGPPPGPHRTAQDGVTDDGPAA